MDGWWELIHADWPTTPTQKCRRCNMMVIELLQLWSLTNSCCRWLGNESAIRLRLVNYALAFNDNQRIFHTTAICAIDFRRRFAKTEMRRGKPVKPSWWRNTWEHWFVFNTHWMTTVWCKDLSSSSVRLLMLFINYAHRWTHIKSKNELQKDNRTLRYTLHLYA